MGGEGGDAGEREVGGESGELDGALLDGEGVAGERPVAEAGVPSGAAPRPDKLRGILAEGGLRLRRLDQRNPGGERMQDGEGEE